MTDYSRTSHVMTERQTMAMERQSMTLVRIAKALERIAAALEHRPTEESDAEAPS